MRLGEIGEFNFSNSRNDFNGIEKSLFVFSRSSRWWNLRWGNRRDTSFLVIFDIHLPSMDVNIFRQTANGKQRPCTGENLSAQFSGSKTYLESLSLKMGLKVRLS